MTARKESRLPEGGGEVEVDQSANWYVPAIPLAKPELIAAIKELDEANQYPDGVEGMDLAIHARDKQIAGMERVREAADKLEKIVPDDLWPLPKYAEMLFIR